MPRIRGNKLLPIIVLGVIFIGIVLNYMSSRQNKSAISVKDKEPIEVADLREDDLIVLGITGDTEKDTVQTLITLVKTFKKDQLEIRNEIDKLKKENERLKKENKQYSTIPNKTNNGIKENNIINANSGLLEEKVNELSDKLNKFISKELIKNKNYNDGTNNNVQIPIGNNQSSSEHHEMEKDEIIWIPPADQITFDKKSKTNNEFTFPTSFNGNEPIRSNVKDLKDTINQPIKDKNNKDREFTYTVPVNSTFTGSVSMTALIGRIPIDGVVSDPYPFKAVIGRENLIANGIKLPNVEGAIVSGTVSGDHVLSCVRGNVKSITFVFEDGKITTIPEQKNNSNNNNEGIGWLSDEFGIPCISGEIKSNAAQYLASVIGLGTAAAASDAIAQQNTTVLTDGGNVTNAVTGNNSQYILGKGLSGGINQTIDWFNKRYGQTFDAVYVPPGHEIAIHITKQLEIDYFYNGRFVNYEVDKDNLGELD
ncbi:MAG: TIGR03752 family integrating conjugative element protein [Gilliamella apicola]|nr:TIGR03752 family integrating conjugative element protein [Gilliamella apicola]